MDELPFTGERMIPDACARTSLYLEHVSRYRLAAGFAPGRRVLDAATGAGYGAAMIAAAGARSVIGVDVDQATVRYATRKYGGPSIEFRVDDVTRLATVPDGSIDLYVCFETIEHVEAGDAVIRHAARVLSENGVFLCSTPNWEVSRCQNPFHKREYTASEFRALLGARFPAVVLLSQRTLFVNQIAPIETADSKRGEQSPASVSRAAIGDAITDPASDFDDSTTAPYLIALGSRSPVSFDASLLTLGVAADTEGLNRHIQNLEGGVAERDDRIATLGAAAVALEAAKAALDAERARVQSESARGAALLAQSEARTADLAGHVSALEVAREESNRYIQNLEGGVGERDARIKDLELTLGRREMALALRIVRGMIRVNRLLGMVPSKSVRRVRHALRGARLATPSSLKVGGAPLFSLVVPVHDNFEFLGPSIESALGQTWSDYECILYDDASTDPRVRPLLETFRAHPRVRLQFGETNLGISGATNRAIAATTGRYVAFLDCDDLLEPNALERVARHIAKHPEADFIYTNRVDVDERDQIVETWDFINRSLGPPDQELLLGMFASHLKAVRRDALRRAGLFRSEFDSVQDYDLALRLSETGRFSFLREALYRHRVHPNQTTQLGLDRQKALAERAKNRALLRRRLAAGEFSGLVSIVVLSLNRVEDTETCLDAIARHTPFRNEVILLDNGSSSENVARLRRVVADRPTVTLHELPENVGCGAGRNIGATRARGEYLVFLDNDIEVREDWLAHLLSEMEADPHLAACCCRVVFPDGTVQFNGGRAAYGERRVRFDLIDTGRREEELGTLETHDCEWVPGGATIFRKSVFDAFPYDSRIAGAYEDNDWSIAVRRAGHRLANCPLATVTHHHMNFSSRARRDGFYTGQRYNKQRLESTLRHFFEKHGVFIEEEDLYRLLGYSGSDAFIESALADQRSNG